MTDCLFCKIIAGEIPSSINLPKGCTLASRCVEAEKICFGEEPEMVETEPGHFVKCHKAKKCGMCPEKPEPET